jgi:phosphate ABC transporter phosphate-binding protein
MHEAYVKRFPRWRRTAGVRILQGLLLVLIVGFYATAHAQVTSLSQAKTLYVDAFSGGAEAGHLRDDFVRRLTKDGRFTLVQSAKSADAVVMGTAEIWQRGFVTINPRNPTTDRQAIYSGYLSLKVVSADGEPLWSWLFSPGRMTWGNIVDDLASRGAEKLIEASKSAPATKAEPTPATAHPRTILTGAGATFPEPLYQKWFEDFEQSHPGTYVRYSPIGSQLEIEALVAGKLDFAGSDGDSDLSAAHLRRIATVVGAVVPIYNLKGVTRDLYFTPQALADIYLGKVRRWNDPEIRQSNKGAHLPDAEIVVIHRSDGSGTSWVWSDFLSKVSPAWSSGVGRGMTLRWPVGSGAEHNDGVAEAVKRTPNAIGYVELSYAIQRGLSFGGVRNRAGEYIHADLDSLAEAAKASGGDGEVPQSITDSGDKYAYPIAAFTWIVVPTKAADPQKKAAVLELLRWVLTTGQKECAALGYVPLPRDVAESQLRWLNRTP